MKAQEAQERDRRKKLNNLKELKGHGLKKNKEQEQEEQEQDKQEQEQEEQEQGQEQRTRTRQKERRKRKDMGEGQEDNMVLVILEIIIKILEVYLKNKNGELFNNILKQNTMAYLFFSDKIPNSTIIYKLKILLFSTLDMKHIYPMKKEEEFSSEYGRLLPIFKPIDHDWYHPNNPEMVPEHFHDTRQLSSMKLINLMNNYRNEDLNNYCNYSLKANEIHKTRKKNFRSQYRNDPQHLHSPEPSPHTKVVLGQQRLRASAKSFYTSQGLVKVIFLEFLY